MSEYLQKQKVKKLYLIFAQRTWICLSKIRRNNVLSKSTGKLLLDMRPESTSSKIAGVPVRYLEKVLKRVLTTEGKKIL